MKKIIRIAGDEGLRDWTGPQAELAGFEIFGPEGSTEHAGADDGEHLPCIFRPRSFDLDHLQMPAPGLATKLGAT